MLDHEFAYDWEWTLPASPEALWPLVSDTDRFNRNARVPAVTPVDPEGVDDQGRRRLRFERLGPLVEWVERPFEWVRPHRFGVVRRYTGGPLAEMRVHVTLHDTPDGGTRLVYRVRAQPRNLLGFVAIPIQIGLVSRWLFGRTFRRYAASITDEGPAAIERAVRFVRGGRTRLERRVERLATELDDAPAEAVRRIGDVLRRDDEISLARMRPYAFAELWDMPGRTVLTAFLHATRGGLLRFRWDVLCPVCRVVKDTGDTLSEVTGTVHCETCMADYEVGLERFVELNFRPDPSIRRVERRDFCVGGPQITPHIIAQRLVPDGTDDDFAPTLEPGTLRLRALRVAGGQALRVVEDGPGSVAFTLGAAGWDDEPRETGRRPRITVRNRSGTERLVILERTDWAKHAATAAQVIALQEFRDLFAGEVLRPGEPMDVGNHAILFTDLLGSTRLYRRIGDAPAFGRVRSHFGIVRAAIEPEDGAVVKTIGDAVMAVFREPASALRAVLRARRRLAAEHSDDALVLKAGIHCGPCLAVTLNGRLDYFGSTVNVAARLDALSSGSDTVISDVVRTDPEVERLIEERGLALERFATRIRGYEDEPLGLWRVRSPRRHQPAAAPRKTTPTTGSQDPEAGP